MNFNYKTVEIEFMKKKRKMSYTSQSIEMPETFQKKEF